MNAILDELIHIAHRQYYQTPTPSTKQHRSRQLKMRKQKKNIEVIYSSDTVTKHLHIIQ